MTEPRPPRRRRTPPVMLLYRGQWGMGEHARIRCDRAVVLNLEASPDADPERPMDATSRQFVPEIAEDVDPADGLDVTFDEQVLRHTDDGCLVVNADDDVE